MLPMQKPPPWYQSTTGRGATPSYPLGLKTKTGMSCHCSSSSAGGSSPAQARVQPSSLTRAGTGTNMRSTEPTVSYFSAVFTFIALESVERSNVPPSYMPDTRNISLHTGSAIRNAVCTCWSPAVWKEPSRMAELDRFLRSIGELTNLLTRLGVEGDAVAALGACSSAAAAFFSDTALGVTPSLDLESCFDRFRSLFFFAGVWDSSLLRESGAGSVLSDDRSVKTLGRQSLQTSFGPLKVYGGG
mmetsp:Transcript_1725/g.6145  ORF Transcript_1725/g.6145 Transcript_1725/m.6145 type:complete len:244 (-) Transcript_1725:505-1236(-)